MIDAKVKIIKRTGIIGGIIIFIALLFGYKEFAQGMIVGVLFSIANFKLLAKNIERSLNKNVNRIHAFFFGNYIFRFLLAGMLLAGSFYFKGLEFFLGVSSGLVLLMKLSVYSLCLKLEKLQ